MPKTVFFIYFFVSLVRGNFKKKQFIFIAPLSEQIIAKCQSSTSLADCEAAQRGGGEATTRQGGVTTDQPLNGIIPSRMFSLTLFYDQVAPELISLDRDALAAVDVPTMQDKVNTPQLKKTFFRAVFHRHCRWRRETRSCL